MPRFQRSYPGNATLVWQGRCPAPKCTKTFKIESDPWQPKSDVLMAFKSVRPKKRHLHGTFYVYEHLERGGEAA